MASTRKKLRLDKRESDVQLEAFIKWMRCKKIIMNKKVYITSKGTSHNYGMMARNNINCDEILFEIPRKALLHPRNCSISDLLESESEEIDSDSKWVPLLLALIHEYQTPNSEWKPYLDLVPDYDQMDQPMFWEKDLMLQTLSGTGIPERVKTDLINMKREYDIAALPFIKNHPDKFRVKECDFELYKKMVAFVMAYSFTETNNEDSDDDSDLSCASSAQTTIYPMMVPLADILNHVSENNAELEFGDTFKMRCIKPIKKGDEVFNTYGCLANCKLLYKHGFALGRNCHNDFQIPMMFCVEQYKEWYPYDNLLQQKLKHLKQFMLVEEESFNIGYKGFLNDKEIIRLLTVLFFNKKEFSMYLRSRRTTNKISSATNDAIKRFPEQWKLLITKCCEKCLNGLTVNSTGQMSANMSDTTKRRLQWSKLVKDGQQELLQNLRTLCT